MTPGEMTDWQKFERLREVNLERSRLEAARNENYSAALKAIDKRLEAIEDTLLALMNLMDRMFPPDEEEDE